MDQYHRPVLLEESIDSLNIRPDGVYVDLTHGGGGHSRAILEKLGPKGHLYAFDQDNDSIANVAKDKRITFIHGNFRFMRSLLRYNGAVKVDGILADLGVSSHHFDDKDRGFSFRFDSRLDMRMNQNATFSALELIGSYEHEQLLKVFRDYGELQMPHKIASAIIRRREEKPIVTTTDLIEAVKPFTPKWEESKFLAKLFQSIRMEVNHETEALRMMLEQSAKVLDTSGRLSVITYHSLEDRLVKNFIKSCNFEGKIERDFFGNSNNPLKSLSSKVIVPSANEIEENPRSRSAKLRVCEKIGVYE